jgi:hypothetical protein
MFVIELFVFFPLLWFLLFRMKHCRALARQEFMAKALIKKARAQAGLNDITSGQA